MPPSNGFFPLRDRRVFWAEVQPRHYPYKITPDALVRAVMSAFVLRISGLRDLVVRQSRVLGTTNFSSLSHALARSVSLRYVEHLVEALQGSHRPGRDDLVALDSMPLTLPRTLRHRCKKFNRSTVGGGVLWSFALRARKGSCPVKIHKVIAGAWNDATLMAGVDLLAHGPVYLMDRGFVDYSLIERWNSSGVRFVLRLRANTVYQVISTLSAPRRYGSGHLELDAVVRLGFPKAEYHPLVRLVAARIKTRSGMIPLLLATGELHWSAERVLDAYKERGKIETFHEFLKTTLGLAHLYSFSRSGIAFLLHAALLLALLMLLASAHESGEVLGLLQRQLDQWRRLCGLGHLWRRNMNARKRDKAAKEWGKLKRKRARNL